MATQIHNASYKYSVIRAKKNAFYFQGDPRFSIKSFEKHLTFFNFHPKPFNLKKSWLRVSLFNFFIAATMGLILRMAHVIEMPWLDFRNMMHGHSHVAMLGWLFLVLYAMILDRFLPAGESQKKIHHLFFWSTQVSVIGMMISFPIQGYQAVSIAFSTIHLVLSYIISGIILRKVWRNRTPSGLLLTTSLLLMLVSTLGVWMIGPISAGLFGNQGMYYAAIQFFLHFQFNGWFTFAVLAMVFQQIEQSKEAVISRSHFNWFYGLLLASTALTYALSVAWSTPEDWIFYLNGAGVLIQLAALVVFWILIKQHAAVFFSGTTTITQSLLILAFVSFAVKILIQTAVVIPQVAVISYTIRQFVVGFVHLTMLGSITCYVLAALTTNGHLSQTKPYVRLGLILIIAGFVSTELFLFLQGLWLWIGWGFFPYYYETIMVASALLPLGIAGLLIGTVHREKTKVPNIIKN